VNFYIWGWTHIAWTWYVTIGASTTFIVGYLASLGIKEQPRESLTGEGA